MKRNYALYADIYANTNGEQIAHEDKTKLEYHMNSNFTYGEALYEHLYALLDYLKPQPG